MLIRALHNFAWKLNCRLLVKLLWFDIFLFHHNMNFLSRKIQAAGYNCAHRLIVMRKWEGRLQILLHINTYEIAKLHAGVQKSLLNIAPMFIFYAKPARLDNMMSLFAFSFIGPEKPAIHNGSKIYLKECM